MQGIYRIVHIDSGRIYIGSAVDFRRRRRGHISDLVAGRHKNAKLQAAWNKYGQDAFTFEFLEVVSDRSELCVREQWFLNELHPYFNLATSTVAPMLGRKQSDKFLEMMRSRKGESRSPEVRAQIAATLRGRKNGPRSGEVKAKISEKLKSHPVSDETRQKIGQKRKGHRHGPEAIEKIREAACKPRSFYPRGPLTEETKARISASKKGKAPRGTGWHHLPETKEKMRQARLRTLERKQEVNS